MTRQRYRRAAIPRATPTDAAQSVVIASPVSMCDSSRRHVGTPTSGASSAAASARGGTAVSYTHLTLPTNREV